MAVHKWIEIFLPSAMAAVPRYRVNLVLFSPPGGVTILPIRLENIGADSLEIDPASHYHSMMEEPADQTNKQQSPTNVATVSCSYAKIIAKLEAMSHENSIRIRMKLGDLTSDWTSATAVKKEGYFECSVDNSELDPWHYLLKMKQSRFFRWISGNVVGTHFLTKWTKTLSVMLAYLFNLNSKVEKVCLFLWMGSHIHFSQAVLLTVTAACTF